MTTEATPGRTSRTTVKPRWRRFLEDRRALAGVVYLIGLVLVSAVFPVVFSLDATATSSETLSHPSAQHLFGTDELGRDLAARLVVGGQRALLVSFGAALVGAAVGVPIGLISGYRGRWVDTASMRIMDVLLALPGLLVALVIVAILGSSTLNLIIAIGIVSVPTFARLVRASVLSLKERDFVLASRAMGASSQDTMARTLLPNVLGPVIVQFVLVAAAAVVTEASLSYLGLGLPPPAPSWGGMIQRAQLYFYHNPWYGVFPGIALTLVVLSLDWIGKGIQRIQGDVAGSGRIIDAREDL